MIKIEEIEDKGDSIISIGLKCLSAKINEVIKVKGSESGEMQFKRVK